MTLLDDLGLIEHKLGTLIEIADQADVRWRNLEESTRARLTGLEADAMRLEAAMDATTKNLAAAGGAISEAWQRTVSLVEDGVLSMQQAIALSGGSVEALRGRYVDLDDAYIRLDLRGRQQELQSLLADVRAGRATIEEAVDAFAAGGGELSARVRQLVDAMKSGAIEAEQALDVIAELQSIADFETGNVGASSNSAFTNLLRLLDQIVRSGGIGGLEERVGDAVAERLGPLLQHGDRPSADFEQALADELRRLGGEGGFR